MRKKISFPLRHHYAEVLVCFLPNRGYTCKWGTNWVGRHYSGNRRVSTKMAAALTDKGVKQDTQAVTAV